MDAIVDAKCQKSGQQQSGHRMLITPERVFYAGRPSSPA